MKLQSKWNVFTVILLQVALAVPNPFVPSVLSASVADVTLLPLSIDERSTVIVLLEVDGVLPP